MADKQKLSSARAFNESIKPFIDHKNAYQEYKGTTTKGGIPQTEAQEKTAAGRKWQKDYIVDPLQAPFQGVWNLLTPHAWRKGKENWIIQEKADVAARKTELKNLRIHRENRDKTRDMIIEIAEKAQKKYEKTGDKKVLDIATQGVTDILNSAGLQMKDFIVVDPEVIALRDGAGLFSTNPNPYPVIENSMWFTGGVLGSIKGEKLMSQKFLKSNSLSSRYSKGPWMARVAGAVLGGALGTATADYGYEGMLDIMSKSGQARKFVDDPNLQASIVDGILAEVVPESWTFGPEGIKGRDFFDVEEQKDRFRSATNAALLDGAFSSIFFGARPAYYSLRRGFGNIPFRLFKDKKVAGVRSSRELIEAEQRLIEKWAPLEGEFKKPIEQLSFHNPLGIPLLGNALWRLSNSKAFNWLGPKGPIKKGSNEWWPDPLEQQATMLSRTVVGGGFGRAIKGAMAPTPLFGMGVSKSLREQSNFYYDMKTKMLGSFAPYFNIEKMGVDWASLASQNARGFRAYARELEENFTKAAEGMGKGFSDKSLVTVAKQVLKEYRRKLQIDPTTTTRRGGAGEDEAARIPQQVSNKLIKFIEEQILKPVGGGRTHSMRDVYQMKGLREQMDDLLKPLEDATLSKTHYEDDITRLFKAWETDVGSVSSSGYPEVVKAFQAYDDFVSKGMLLWGTDIGKAAAKVDKRGFSITVENSPTRAGQSLFEVLINSAKKKPGTGLSELAAVRRIVGDRGYHNGVGVYIRNAFHDAINDPAGNGIFMFNADKFRASLGLGKEGSSIKQLMNDALPGPQVKKLEIFDASTGLWKEFDDELYEKGINKGLKDVIGEEVPEGALKTNPEKWIRTKDAKLPTMKEFEELADILERVFVDGVPNTAKFMMRRSVIGGFSGAIRAVMPTRALGGKYGQAAAQAGVGALGIGPWSMLAATWLLNYGGRVLTRPPSIKVLKNIWDENLPETIRLANIFRLVRMYPEEWMAFDADLTELETQQRMFEKSNRLKSEARGTIGKVKDALVENVVGPTLRTGQDIATDPFGTLKEGIKKSTEIPGNPSILRKLMGGDPSSPDATEVPYSSGYGNTGSSIMNNPNMNPAAASSLYQGDTDAALANQFGGGTQYAAGGGLMELNPIMNNQGKYTDIQQGINDNPFTKAQNKGILGVL